MGESEQTTPQSHQDDFSSNRSPQSPITPKSTADDFHQLDLDALDTKLQDRDNIAPRRPPSRDAFEMIDASRRTLLNWGLDHAQIDCARRWDQLHDHHTAEAMHMQLLAECAQSLSASKPSLQLLMDEYEDKKSAYDDFRYEATLKHKDHPCTKRAEDVVKVLLSEMVERKFSVKDMALYQDATRRGEATMQIVAEYCEAKLRELKGEGDRPARRLKPHRPPQQKLRRSSRIRKLEKRKKISKS